MKITQQKITRSCYSSAQHLVTSKITQADLISTCFYFNTSRLMPCVVCLHGLVSAASCLALHKVVIGLLVIDVTQQVDVKQGRVIVSSVGILMLPRS